MTGRHSHQLHDPLSQIRLHDINTLFGQKWSHSALFGQHGFTFYQILTVMFFDDFIYYSIVLLRILSPMHMNSVFHGMFFELFQIVSQMADGMLFYTTCHLPQFLPFRHTEGHFITFLPDKKKGLVVPPCPFLIGYKFFGRFSMCTHNLEVKISMI